MFVPSWLWLLGLLACSLVSAEYYNTKTADKDYLLKQKKVYNLLYHISQPAEINYTWYEEGQKWDIEANIDLYSNAAAVKEFLYMYKNGMLPRGEMFSFYYIPLLKEIMAVFRLFYYANDFETFYKTALWARNNINENMYMLAFYNAVIRRPDTQYIQLPPPYELYPNCFFNSEVMQKAQHASMFGLRDTSGEHKAYILAANYSGWYLNRDYYLENKLNYFTEDIGLNSYYFFLRLAYPSWMPSSEFGLLDSLRGIEYLYGHQQLMNRYYLERLANDLPKLEDFDWQKPFYAGYYPTMIHGNGLPFPQRPEQSNFPVYKYKYIKDIIDRESRLTAAIDAGYVFGNGSKWYNIYNEEEGLNILGNIIEGNADSYNRKFYGSIDFLGRKILGYNLEPSSKHKILPSALEIISTSMRDPAFYRLYKRIMDLYYRYKMRQAPYSRDELIYPNLKIESFSVDKLITYFDQFNATINNGIFINENDKMSLVKVRQYRLNHIPFNFHITINSDKPTKAAIRIFLGPKYDSHHRLYELPENLKYFYEIDNWILDLNAGLNKISRNSQDCFFTIPDQEPSEVFYGKLMASLHDDKPFTYNERLFGFPERLLLPKGKKEGMPLQLFLYISPVTSEYRYMSRIWGNYKFDNRPFGFPLDKPLDGLNYDGPNMLFKDILIYHKDEFDTNIIY